MFVEHMTQVRVRGVSIEVRDEGDGPAVILLHGFPTSGELWRRVAPLLVAAGLRVAVPDLVGYGRSDAPADGIDMASQATVVLELQDALGIDRAAIVAHDVGTAAAQILAARAPARVRALVLIDGVSGEEWALDAVQSIRDWNVSAAARLTTVLSRTLREPGLDRDALAALLAPYEGAAGGLRLIRAARALDPAQTRGIAGRVRQAGVPALVLWGDADRYLSAATVGASLAAAIGAELKVLPGGHFLPLAAPADVAREVLAFLRATP